MLRLVTLPVAQHGFYAEPRLRLWSIVRFADSFAPLSRFGLPRRGHRLFGNVVSFGKLLGVSITYGFGEKRCRKNLPLCDSAFWTTTHTNPQQTAALPMPRLPVRPLQRGRSGCLSSSVYRPSVAIYCSRPRALRIHSSTLGLRCFFSH